jgi:hypothetical protein
MRTCSCSSPPGELCRHQWEEIDREAAQRGSVVWQDSARGGGGHYRWSLGGGSAMDRSGCADCEHGRCGQHGVLTGLAETESEGWRRVREYVAAPYREFRRRQRW